MIGLEEMVGVLTTVRREKKEWLSKCSRTAHIVCDDDRGLRCCRCAWRPGQVARRDLYNCCDFRRDDFFLQAALVFRRILGDHGWRSVHPSCLSLFDLWSYLATTRRCRLAGLPPSDFPGVRPYLPRCEGILGY
jgi:hypothetical protein